MRIFEFRSEVILWSVNNILWALLFLAVVQLLFTQVTSIAGWGKTDVMLVMMTQELFIGLMWFWINPSLLSLMGTIRNGNFDGYLLKPIHSQYMATTMKFEFDNYPRTVVLLGVFYFIFSSNHLAVTIGQIIGFFLMFGTGMVIFYSIFFMFVTLTFWLTQISNLEELFDNTLSVAKYPAYIFQGGARFFFFYILPVVYISTFPVEVLRGRAGWDRIGLGFVLAFVFLFISNRFWHFAIRRYSSASS